MQSGFEKSVLKCRRCSAYTGKPCFHPPHSSSIRCSFCPEYGRRHGECTGVSFQNTERSGDSGERLRKPSSVFSVSSSIGGVIRTVVFGKSCRLRWDSCANCRRMQKSSLEIPSGVKGRSQAITPPLSVMFRVSSAYSFGEYRRVERGPPGISCRSQQERQKSIGKTGTARRNCKPRLKNFARRHTFRTFPVIATGKILNSRIERNQCVRIARTKCSNKQNAVGFFREVKKKFRIIGSVDPPAVDLPSSSFGPDPVNIRPHLQEFVHAFEFRCHDFSSGLRPCLFAFQLLKYKEIRAGAIYL